MPAEALRIGATGQLSLALPSNNEGIYFINTGIFPARYCAVRRKERKRREKREREKRTEREGGEEWMIGGKYGYRDSRATSPTARLS